MIKFKDILVEAKNQFEDFSQTRMGGAKKIADSAHKKGGLALLTWHHFKVKAPYYKKASEGKLDLEKAKKNTKKLIKKFL